MDGFLHVAAILDLLVLCLGSRFVDLSFVVNSYRKIGPSNCSEVY